MQFEDKIEICIEGLDLIEIGLAKISLQESLLGTDKLILLLCVTLLFGGY